MTAGPVRAIAERIAGVVDGWVEQIRTINRKYAKPRIVMDKKTRIALLFLRLYLISLVILLGYKFWTMLSGGG